MDDAADIRELVSGLQLPEAAGAVAAGTVKRRPRRVVVNTDKAT